jgi:cytochrome c biogenesis protein CcdA
MQDLINQALEHFSVLISHQLWFAPLLAFLAGMLTSLTPCSLSSIPLVIAYVGGASKDHPKIAFRFSLVFALGMALTFTALGTAASLLGKLLNIGTAPWWYIVLGLLMIAMALQTWGVITLIPATYAQSKGRKKGYAGAFGMGILGGLFSSPCATPVLIALLALVARGTNPLWGTFLLLLYSIGHGILSVGAGTFMGLTGKLTRSSRYGFFPRV